MQLINWDCLEEMKKIKDNSVDLIVTDPPFEHIKWGMKSKKFNVGLMSKNSFLNTELNNFKKENVLIFLEWSKRLFKKSYNWYYFASKLQVPYYLEFATKNKLNFDILIYDRDKNNMTSTKFYASNIDYVIRIYWKWQWLRNIWNIEHKSQYYQKIQTFKKPNNYWHPTEKPLKLIENYLLLSSNEWDIILDPFMWSWTTGVACKNLNRDFIGIELDKEYFKIAEEIIKVKNLLQNDNN